MALLPLVFCGLCVTAHLVFGGDVKLNLDCNNDMENIFCQFEAKNCSEYRLTIQDDVSLEYSCPLQQWNNKCCCSKELTFTFNETFTAKVFRRNEEVEVKSVNTTESFKAKAPTIVSVKGSNGNMEIRWKTNMKDHFNTWITAEVTVYKQGDMTDKVLPTHVTSAMDGDLQYHVINGKDLDSDTTYMIRVRSFTEWNKMYSDSSNVVPFKTSPNSNSNIWALLLGLGVFAVLLSVFLFVSFIKLKRKWWDIYSEPKMTVSHIINPRVITMIPPIEISECVTEEEMSKKLLFPEIQEANQGSGCSQEMKNKNNSGSSEIFNQTYSLLLPNCSVQRKMDSFEVQSQTERFSGSLYSPDTSDNSHSSLPVKTDFHSVPSKVEQPDAVLLQKINAGFEHLLKKYPEETFNPQPNFSPFPPGFINNIQDAQCPPRPLLPIFPTTSTDKTIEVINDYHCV